jgi:hypothetical protein
MFRIAKAFLADKREPAELSSSLKRVGNDKTEPKSNSHFPRPLNH